MSLDKKEKEEVYYYVLYILDICNFRFRMSLSSYERIGNRQMLRCSIIPLRSGPTINWTRVKECMRAHVRFGQIYAKMYEPIFRLISKAEDRCNTIASFVGDKLENNIKTKERRYGRQRWWINKNTDLFSRTRTVGVQIVSTYSVTFNPNAKYFSPLFSWSNRLDTGFLNDWKKTLTPVKHCWWNAWWYQVSLVCVVVGGLWGQTAVLVQMAEINQLVTHHV